MENTKENPSLVEEKSEYEVVGIKFNNAGKEYFFDPRGISFDKDECAVVETSRGTEYGFVTQKNKTVPKEKVYLPLRPVIRKATPDDALHYEENLKKEREAEQIFYEKTAEHKLSMKLVDVEYTFDNTKLLFYFTSDGRVDFRELVKDLASVFKTRIELRQIGIRDETKLVGGLGVCGLPYCCKKFLDDFGQVTIKMAKEQNLSLNSQKISGACGRLMCCLRYEQNAYEDAMKNLPKIDSVVETPDGRGSVCEVAPLTGIIKVKLSDSDNGVIRPYPAEDIKIIFQKEQNESSDAAQESPSEV